MASRGRPDVKGTKATSSTDDFRGSSADEPSSANSDAVPQCKTPIALVVGMAGSGKTTLVNALSWFLDEHDSPALARAEKIAAEGSVKSSKASGGGPSEVEDEEARKSQDGPGDEGEDDEGMDGAYVVNLDPAVLELPYEPNIDIRDTVKYRDVMREYSLGPNGAIITSLNLFATRFDQVLDLIQKRAPECKSVIMDTPGQIETFTWSASGAIITESIASILPTVVLFVVDTARCKSAMTFVSNMLYACSIMYKTRLPMVVVFNKIDVTSSAFAEAWMRDFDAFDAALKEDNFAGTLARSMAQALEEFYNVMRCVSVSAATEEGLGDLVAAIDDAAVEYEKEYRPALERKRADLREQEDQRRGEELSRLREDLETEKRGPHAGERDTAWAPGEDDEGIVQARSPLDPPRGSPDLKELGAGSRRLRELRQERSGAEQPAVEEEEIDPEDAEAYADFVKYLEGLNMRPKGKRHADKHVADPAADADS